MAHFPMRRVPAPNLNFTDVQERFKERGYLKYNLCMTGGNEPKGSLRTGGSPWP
jgi:hypothetical protein